MTKAVVFGDSGKEVLQLKDGRFVDYRWKGGRWDLTLFQNGEGMNWDAWNKVRYWLMTRGHSGLVTPHTQRQYNLSGTGDRC